ncbi:MAG TPA: hypothetical protein VHL54_11400 [Actinomycetota bacterium]|nr:hypothetical protein [Actinomycetota bacterium]
MSYEDDAENARAALRAIWGASGQLDGADSLGTETQFAGVNIPTDSRAAGNDGKGGEGGHFGSTRHGEVGLKDFAASNEPTFDRGEAAAKLKDAWRSTLTAEGKMGSQSRPLSAAAKATTSRAATPKASPGAPGEPAADPDGSAEEPVDA